MSETVLECLNCGLFVRPENLKGASCPNCNKNLFTIVEAPAAPAAAEPRIEKHEWLGPCRDGDCCTCGWHCVAGSDATACREQWKIHTAPLAEPPDQKAFRDGCRAMAILVREAMDEPDGKMPHTHHSDVRLNHQGEYCWRCKVEKALGAEITNYHLLAEPVPQSEPSEWNAAIDAAVQAITDAPGMENDLRSVWRIDAAVAVSALRRAALAAPSPAETSQVSADPLGPKPFCDARVLAVAQKMARRLEKAAKDDIRAYVEAAEEIDAFYRAEIAAALAGPGDAKETK